MLTIHVDGVSNAPSPMVELDEGVSPTHLLAWVREFLGVSAHDVYFLHNGKKIQTNRTICDGVVRVVLRLPGGKGGFGSMLRAIGAQIEKTTNREACRDLSGRRLRDINEEQRLKNWISKKADRERDAVERKKKKIEKLRSEPKVEFNDKKYEEVRSKLTGVVHDAVEKGFQASASKASTSTTIKKPERKKGFMLEDEELSDISVTSSDELSGSDEEGGSKQKISSESDSDEPSSTKKIFLKDKRKMREDSSDNDSDESDSDKPSPAKKAHLDDQSNAEDSSSDEDSEADDTKREEAK